MGRSSAGRRALPSPRSTSAWRTGRSRCGCGPERARRGRPATVARVELEQAIRTRRTHKAYGPDPVAGERLDDLLELARWAPNHNLTNPWRFRVLGPGALE